MRLETPDFVIRQIKNTDWVFVSESLADWPADDHGDYSPHRAIQDCALWCKQQKAHQAWNRKMDETTSGWDTLIVSAALSGAPLGVLRSLMTGTKAHTHVVAVHPDARGKGVFSLMIQAALWILFDQMGGTESTFDILTETAAHVSRKLLQMGVTLTGVIPGTRTPQPLHSFTLTRAAWETWPKDGHSKFVYDPG
jgi:GNAT superfamily N-acetyltransferase